MMTRCRVFRAGLCLLLLAVPASGQLRAGQSNTTATLVVTGDVDRTLSLAPAELKGLPRSRVEMKSEDGAVHVYEGVLAGELLKLAGVTLGQMRGNAVTSHVVATASDGYQAVFALVELDPAFSSHDIIVADTVDGKPLSGNLGAFRIVAPRDLRGVRSVRMLTRLEVVPLKK